MPGNGAARDVLATEHCQFVVRCLYAMDVCHQQTPPLFRTDERRAAACFLHAEAPGLKGDDLDQVLAAREVVATAEAPRS